MTTDEPGAAADAAGAPASEPTAPASEPTAPANSRGAPAFGSILFPGDEAARHPDRPAEPGCFRDLNLDQIVEAVTAGRDEYDLTPFFHAPLATADAIAYRHEVLRDLERAPVRAGVTAFAEAMRLMRERLGLAARLYYTRQKERWFLDAVAAYCDAVTGLARDLAEAGPDSRGLRAFHSYLAHYASSPGFTLLAERTAALRHDLSEVSYSLHIRGNRVRVRRYEGEEDYSRNVTATFEKFRQGDVKDYLVRFPSSADMDHVEAGVLDLVAKLYPETFQALTSFCAAHQGYLDATVASFDREIQFYIAHLEYLGRFRAAGLRFCYPEMSTQGKDVHARQTFDLALAGKLVPGNTVVCNDVHLTGPERILVVSGPNQGGKTTLARTFGQLHYLARLGWLVPGADARLYLADEIFTHFEKQEDLGDLSGKLQDDLIRIHQILRRATPASIVIMNEIFTSTTLTDALYLARNVMAAIIDLDVLCVCVTFLDELASLGPATVSMVSTVVPEDPAVRTYRVIRKPADGLAHALAIAARHGLTYDQLRERIAS